jgi:hypothetical protein
VLNRILLAVTAAAVITVTGCSAAAPDVTGDPTTAGTSAASTGSTATSGLGDPGQDSGDLPDPCTLLTRPQVLKLTGAAITQIDPDGGRPGDASRFCQWQLSEGQLAVFLSRTSAADFAVRNDQAQPVDGVGDDAYQLAGHLYVRHGPVQVDVYARGGTDTANLAVARNVANLVLPQI